MAERVIQTGRAKTFKPGEHGKVKVRIGRGRRNDRLSVERRLNSEP